MGLLGIAVGFMAEAHAAGHVKRLECTKAEESKQSVTVDFRSSLQLCFVAGKGGAVKASVSGASATTLSQREYVVFTVSPDPDIYSLTVSKPSRRRVGAPENNRCSLEDENLYALEIDGPIRYMEEGRRSA